MGVNGGNMNVNRDDVIVDMRKVIGNLEKGISIMEGIVNIDKDIPINKDAASMMEDMRVESNACISSMRKAIGNIKEAIPIDKNISSIIEYMEKAIDNIENSKQCRVRIENKVTPRGVGVKVNDYRFVLGGRVMGIMDKVVPIWSDAIYDINKIMSRLKSISRGSNLSN